MRRTLLGTVLIGSVTGVVWLALPSAMEGQSGRRAGVQLVQGHEAVAREALVRLRRPPLPADLAALRAHADADALEGVGGTGVLRLRSRSIDAAALVALLSRRGDVLYAEPNYVVRALERPDDASFPQLWGLENVGQGVNGGLPGRADSDIRAVPAWDVSVGSTDHVVAIIDTGIDYTHPDLAPNVWSAPARFTVTLGGRPIVCDAGTHGFNSITRTCDPMDDHMHGTHVAGTIGASGNDGNGVVGVNWTAQLLGLKFLDANGSGTTADAIDCIRFAIAAKQAFPGSADIRVLSNSWGGGGFSQALQDEILAAQDEDMLFVAAAGNDGSNNDLFPFYPSGYEVPNVVAVAATTNTDERASFSNYGSASVDLGAPGVDILSTIPGNSYRFASGTSMATPHVSGAAALVLSRCTLDTAGLKDALLATVQPVAALSSLTAMGGRLDVNSAIHSCVAPPEVPTNLEAVGADAQVQLSWSASVGATRYAVWRSLGPGGPYAALASDVKGARYTDTAVLNGTTYYYVVQAANSLGESGDSNEASATPSRPSDLVVSTLTAPANAGAGGTIAVSLTTANQSGVPAAASTTRVYLSANALFDTGDLPLEPPQQVPALAPGASSSASLSLTVPSDTPAGLWYLVAFADALRVVTETAEGNNTALRSVRIGPDLVVTAIDAPSTAAPGAAIPVSDTVKNQGGGDAAASATHFYLSANFTLDSSDTLLAAARVVPALGVNASSTGASTVTLPATLAAGPYYLIAKADGDGAVAESLETNNTTWRSIGIGADLVHDLFQRCDR